MKLLTSAAANKQKLRINHGFSVKELQDYFGFEQPQAIYKWQWGESLPNIDNLYALSRLFNVSIDTIPIGDDEDFFHSCCFSYLACKSYCSGVGWTFSFQ